MAQLLKKSYPLPPLVHDWSKPYTESEHHKAFAAIQEPIIRFRYADSYAFYRVASMNPLKLQHIPYMDAWQVPYAMIRGLRKADVEAMVDRQKRGWNF